MKNYDLFESLKQEIKNDNSPLKDWSENYFHTHKKRYLSDLNILDDNYSSGRILEIGSAPYHMTYLIHKKGLPLCGVDISPERQSSFITNVGLKIKECNIEESPLPFEDNMFHYILLNEVFEHLRINPIKTLKEINRVLHPDGILVLSTPNLYNIRNIVNLMLGKGFDDPYAEFSKIEKLGHMGHVREYSTKQVAKFLDNTGYKSTKILKRSYNSLKGMWTPFNLVRKLIPGLHEYQIHICKKQTENL